MCCKDTVSLLAKCSDSVQEICSTWGRRANAESQVIASSCVMVLARTGSVFAVGGRRHGQDTEVILHHLMSLLRAGERDCLPDRRDSFQLKQLAEGAVQCCRLSGGQGCFRVNSFFSCSLCH